MLTRATLLRMKGRLLVIGQFALLAVLVVCPSLPLSGSPPDPWRSVGYAVALLGGVLLLGAAPTLGRGLTPFPEPLSGAALRSSGLYGVVRHPMYTGVLMIGWGLALRGWSVLGLIAAVGLTLLLMAKARYEEQLLRAAYPGYADYAANVGRFVPGIGRGR